MGRQQNLVAGGGEFAKRADDLLLAVRMLRGFGFLDRIDDAPGLWCAGGRRTALFGFGLKETQEYKAADTRSALVEWDAVISLQIKLEDALP